MVSGSSAAPGRAESGPLPTQVPQELAPAVLWSVAAVLVLHPEHYPAGLLQNTASAPVLLLPSSW